MGRHRSLILLALAALILLVLGGVLSACGASAEDETQPPASVEKSTVAGQPSRLFLTAQALQNLGVQTVAVAAISQSAIYSTTTTVSSAAAPAGSSTSTSVAGTGRTLAVPYSAVVYDPNGQAWVFTNPQPLQFIRAPVTIDQIQGDTAILSSGPAVGTLIVRMGAEELLGTEYGVGHE
jgi:hypothetical protein